MREIRKRMNIKSKEGSSIRQSHETKQFYSVIETHNKEDFHTLLGEWPEGSFDCQDTVVVTREYIGVKLKIEDVDTKFKFDLPGEEVIRTERKDL